MGDQVGQLFYGVELTEEESEKILNLYNSKGYEKEELEYFSWIGEQENRDLTDFLGSSLVNFESPYETEEYFIKVKETFQEAFNGSQGLGKAIETKAENWDELLKIALNKLGLPQRESEWFLVGRYN